MLSVFKYIYLFFICIPFHGFHLGEPGFRNIRDGGETVAPDTSGPFMVYIVFYSMKHPPAKRRARG